MAWIQIKARIRLSEPLVVSAWRGSSYSPISWITPRGDKVRVALPISAARIATRTAGYGASDNWWDNRPVGRLLVSLVLGNVDHDTMLRLRGKHPTEKSFM